MEIFSSTRPQDGHTWNDDSFVIRRGEVTLAAICDGSGASGGVAKRALKILGGLAFHSPVEEFEKFHSWANWTHLMDSALLGGAQSTFVAVAILNNRVVGVCAGDSRLYRLTVDGEVQILTEGSSKFRLGSGKVDPFPIHQQTAPGDILLLMSDGAWTPLNLSKLRTLWGQSAWTHFSEFPSMLLDEAGKSGRADDMTVIAIRV